MARAEQVPFLAGIMSGTGTSVFPVACFVRSPRDEGFIAAAVQSMAALFKPEEIERRAGSRLLWRTDRDKQTNPLLPHLSKKITKLSGIWRDGRDILPIH